MSTKLGLMIVHSKQRSTVPTKYHSTVRKSKFHVNKAKNAFRYQNCGGSCACTSILYPFVDNSEFFEYGLFCLCIGGLSLHGNTQERGAIPLPFCTSEPDELIGRARALVRVRYNRVWRTSRRMRIWRG